MKHTLLPILVAAALFTGCSSAYKSSQTPDDVYYSPARAVREHANADEDDQYTNDYASSEDNYLRMKMRNRYRWSAIDDYDYWNSPNYAYNNYYGSFGSYNPYFNNSWYSAYYSPFSYGLYPSVGFSWYNSYYPSYGYGIYTPIYVVKNPTVINTVSRPSLSGSYLNRSYNNANTNSVTRQGYNNTYGRAFTPSSSGRYNNSNNNTYYNFNNRRNTNNSNNNNTYTPPSSPSRSYTPSSSSSSSSGGSSGGGSVSRPPRH